MRMALVDEYRRYAEECVALAHGLSDPADRARLLQMAQAWRDLAHKLDEKNGNNNDGRRPKKSG